MVKLCIKSPKMMALICLVPLVLLLIGYILYHNRHLASKPVTTKAVTIATTTVVRKPVIKQHRFIGTIVAENNINLASEINGVVEQVKFHSGRYVVKNDLLVVLKHDRQQAALAKAQAVYDNALAVYQRSQALLKQKATAPANVVSDRDKYIEAKADLALAGSNYNNCFIKAPFNGLLGIRQVNIGQYLKSGDSIVNLQTAPAQYIDFYVPQKLLGDLKINNQIIVESPASATINYQAAITAIDSDVNNTARTTRVRAHFNNPLHWRAGSYVPIIIKIISKHPQLQIPALAVDYQPYGASVYSIKDGRAHLTYINIKDRSGNNVVVDSGLQPGEKIVIAGQNKLHDNDKVIVDNQYEKTHHKAQKPS